LYNLEKAPCWPWFSVYLKNETIELKLIFRYVLTLNELMKKVLLIVAYLKNDLEKSRWWLAGRPWYLDLHDFKKLLQIFMAARIM
jgi:hypothetical protein